MKPGTIVFYFDKDRITAAVCLEGKDTRLHLFSEHSRELNLGLSRVIHSIPNPLEPSGSRENLLKSLKAMLEKAEVLKAGIDTEELWNLVQGEAERLDLNYLAELVFGNNPAPPSAARCPASHTARMGQRHRVIAILDDEEDYRRALSRLLRAHGYDVASFSAGEELIAGLARRSFDCVLLDLHMPGMTGFDVLARCGTSRHRRPSS